MLRLAAAVLVAPYLAWLARTFLESATHMPALVLASVAARSAVYVYVFALPLGVLALAVAWRLGRTGLFVAMSVGAACAALYLLPYALNVVFSENINSWLKRKVASEVAIELLFGSAVGALVWLLGVWRNAALLRARGSVEPNAVASTSGVNSAA